MGNFLVCLVYHFLVHLFINILRSLHALGRDLIWNFSKLCNICTQSVSGFGFFFVRNSKEKKSLFLLSGSCFLLSFDIAPE